MSPDTTSALYFLVWHIGMSYTSAMQRYVAAEPVIRKYWAIRGRVDGKPCFDALVRWVDRSLTYQIVNILKGRDFLAE